MGYEYIQDKHALFSPSEKAWIRYDKEKIVNKVQQAEAILRGTLLHELAASCIKLKVTLGKENGIISEYVQDCIQCGCETERQVYYSEYIYGTADAIRFDVDARLLYIFDLKTGEKAVPIDQVLIYAAIWCLEHGISPEDINYDLRIYSNTRPIRLATEESGPQVAAQVRKAMDQIVFVNNTTLEYKGGHDA